jgi:hypothetical protein
MCSAPARWLDLADYDKRGSPGVDLDPAPGIKLINLVVHDAVDCGIGQWHSGPDWEANGCLVYYNGWDSQDRGHGHGFYASSAMDDMTPKLLKDNIVFNNYCLGFQVYNSGPGRQVGHYELTGNVSFNNGTISRTNKQQASHQILVGCSEVGTNDNLHENYVYTSPGADGTGIMLGWERPLDSPILRDNYVVAGTALQLMFDPGVGPRLLGTPTFAGNTFCGEASGDATRPGNTYLSGRPTKGLHVFVRPNDYEPGRANIVVYNWEGRKSVAVDVSEVLKGGDVYEVRDAQNFFGAPVIAGTYSGGKITIPLPDETAPVAQIYGDADHFLQPAHTTREFNAFVLLRAATTGR